MPRIPHPKPNHPWKHANLTISSAGIARSRNTEARRHCYARDAEGAVWMFLSDPARGEWLRQDERRKKLTFQEAKAVKSTVLTFDPEMERVLADKAKQRAWKRKREEREN